MKHVSLAVVACAALMSIPNAASPQAARPALHLHAPADGMSVNFAADSIQRSDPASSAASPYASNVRLKGNVEIRLCCVQRATEGNASSAKSEMNMYADEAEYNGATSEIVAHGTVRVNFRDPR